MHHLQVGWPLLATEWLTCALLKLIPRQLFSYP